MVFHCSRDGFVFDSLPFFNSRFISRVVNLKEIYFLGTRNGEVEVRKLTQDMYTVLHKPQNIGNIGHSEFTQNYQIKETKL